MLRKPLVRWTLLAVALSYLLCGALLAVQVLRAARLAVWFAGLPVPFAKVLAFCTAVAGLWLLIGVACALLAWFAFHHGQPTRAAYRPRAAFA
jgi:hypothetical protein